MLIFGANRRWQANKFGVNFSRIIGSPSSQRVKEFAKRFPLVPPQALFRTLQFIRYRELTSFYPAIPVREQHSVYLEAADALFDFNAKKRSVYRPLVKLLLCACRGDIIFYSETAKQSFYNMFGFHAKRYRVMDPEEWTAEILKHEPRMLEPIAEPDVNICFAGPFYLKGGPELIQAVEVVRTRYDLQISCHIFVPRSEWSAVSLAFQYLNWVKVSEIDEADPGEFYDALYGADGFILPTLYDSHAIVAKEAKAAGCWVCTTNVFDTASSADVSINHPNNPFKLHLLKKGVFADDYIAARGKSDRAVVGELSSQVQYALTTWLGLTD